MTMDRLSSLLHHFNLHASTFHRGGFCGTSSHGEQEPHGYIHLLRAGRINFREGDGRELRLEDLLVLPYCYHHDGLGFDGMEFFILLARSLDTYSY